MADWEESSPDFNPRARRAPKASAAQQSKAELLQAIAARRQAQLHRRNRASSPPSGWSATIETIVFCTFSDFCNCEHFFRNQTLLLELGTGIGDLRVISCPQAECYCHGDGSGAASYGKENTSLSTDFPRDSDLQ